MFTAVLSTTMFLGIALHFPARKHEDPKPSTLSIEKWGGVLNYIDALRYRCFKKRRVHVLM